MLSPLARRILFASPWLRNVADEAREAIVALLEEISVPQGAVIFREGDEPENSYLLVAGAVDCSRSGTTLMRLGPGDALGLVLGADDFHPVTATAALDCRLLALRRADWPRLEAFVPEVDAEVRRTVARRLEVALARKAATRSEVVAIRSDEPWPARRETVLALAEALERELGAPVAVVTGCSREAASAVTPARENDRDWVLPGDPGDPSAFRERATRELGEGLRQVRFVLAELHESLSEVDLGLTADILVERVTGQEPPEPGRRGARIFFLHDERDGPGPSMGEGVVVRLPADEPARRRGVERLARRICGRSVGLALGSGAAWGMAHIGVLEVLEEAGVPIDFVAGASMGAIVGAHYALGLSPAEIHEMATRVKTPADFVRILPDLLYLAADFNLVQPGVFAGQHFKQLLSAIAPIEGATFADLQIPFRAVATDIETGARAELRDGELVEAVHASFAAPGIFSAHRVGDGVYIDGGMVDPVPAETVRRMGADLVIAVNVVPPLDPDVRTPLDRMMASLGRLNPLAALRREDQRRLPGAFDAIVRTLQLMQYQLGNDRAGDADVLINPQLKEFWLLEFWAGEAMIRKGAEATREALPAIQERIEAWRKDDVDVEG